MTLTLYEFSPSLNSGVARLALREKGLEYEARPLNLLALDHLEPGYVRLNSRAVVPTLVDGGEIVRDIVRILRYLDRRAPEPPLFPKTESTDREEWIRRFEATDWEGVAWQLASPARRLVMRRFRQLRRIKLGRMMRDAPVLRDAYARRLAELAGDGSDSARATAAAAGFEKLRDDLRALDAHLARDGRRFVAGDEYSAADLLWTVGLFHLDSVKRGRFWRDGKNGAGLAALDAYYARLKNRPSFVPALARPGEMRRLVPLVVGALPVLLFGDWLIEP